MKRTLRPGLGPTSDHDLVVAFAAAFLDVDVSAKGRGDRRGEIAAGELLGALVEGQVSVGDVDGLVRHDDIVTPFPLSNYTYEYTYSAQRRKG